VASNGTNVHNKVQSNWSHCKKKANDIHRITNFLSGGEGGGGVTPSWLTFKPSLFRNQLFLSQWRIIHILRKRKDHYLVHNSPPLVPIPSQINLVHTLSSYFLRYTFILTFHLWLCLRNVLFHSGFHTRYLYVFLFSSTSSTRPAHLIVLDLILCICHLVHSTSHEVHHSSVFFLLVYCCSLPLGPKYLFQHPIIQNRQPNNLTLMWDTKFHTHTNNTRKCTSLNFNLYIFKYETEDKRFWTEW